MEAVKMMLEFVECSKVKRLTLTPHYDPRVDNFVVNEVLTVFKQEKEEEIKAEEEAKRRQEEEEKKKQEKDTSDDMVIETSVRIIEDKGKAVASEHDPLVLMLQEQLA
ncbi:hypothetical protein A2U01_0056667, partial [Trifolium medium]|nr:hypothetical protein [Trifolium medium]